MHQMGLIPSFGHGLLPICNRHGSLHVNYCGVVTGGSPYEGYGGVMIDVQKRDLLPFSFQEHDALRIQAAADHGRQQYQDSMA